MAFGDSAILDSFNRADGDGLGTDWTEPIRSTDVSSDFDISGNAAANGAGAGVVSSAYYDVSTFGPDCEAYVTFPAKPKDTRLILVCLRLANSPTADGYGVRVTPAAGAANDVWRIDRLDDNVFTQLGLAITQEVANGEKIGAEAIGDQISAYYYTAGAWSSLGARTEGTYGSAGYLGMITNSDTTLDDFGGGTVGGGAGDGLTPGMLQAMGIIF